MNDTFETASEETPASTPVRSTKSATVIKLLSRNRGATLAEIMAATHWQPHSSRAFLTGLRKKGMVLIKESRRDGETSYRIER
jgi:DNA-binding IclR family transcriptional regulator